MKKALAISLLVICNVAAVFALFVVSLFVLYLTFSLPVTILIVLAAVAALGFASSQVFFIFEQKYSLKARWFILASYVPSVVGAIVCDIVNDILALFLFFPAVTYLISGAAWVSNVTSRSHSE